MICLRCIVLVMSIISLRHVMVSTAESQAFVSQAGAIESSYPDALVATCVLFCIAAKFIAVSVAVAAEHGDARVAWRRFDAWRNCLEWLWMPALCGATYAGQFGHWLAQAELQGYCQAVLICVWFAPSFVFIAALELSAAQLEADLQRQRGPWIKQRWLTRMRLGIAGQLMTCFAPVLILMSISDLVRWVSPAVPDLWRLVIALAVVATVTLSLSPIWMRWTIGAHLLKEDHPLRQRLGQLCGQLQMEAPRLMLVDDRSWSGAALVGCVPPNRQLWIGRRLLDELSPEQLDMVLLHELAHQGRGHLWWRLLPLLVVALVLIALLGQMSPETLSWTALWLIAACAGGLVWLLGWISHYCELDADRTACQHASRLCGWSAGRPACAARALAGALEHLEGPVTAAKRSSWLHPSLYCRLRSLSLSHAP